MKTVRSKDGTELAYDVVGSGPPLVYITGASCFRRFMPIVHDSKQFGRDFTVYTYDRRGRGDSGDSTPGTVEREVEDIEAIIDASGGEAHLLGHSSGAVLAIEAALRISEKVRSMVIYDAAYVSEDESAKRDYDELGREVYELLDEGKNARAMRTFLGGIGTPRIFTALLPLVPGWRTMKELAPTLRYDIALTDSPPPLERISSIAVPTGVLVGEKSPSEMHGVAKQIAEAMPNGTFAQVSGQDHMVSAKALRPLLLRFLQSRRSA